MVEEKVPYLAGCVFYLLLRKAAYGPTSARQRQAGVKDDHKNPTFMADLVYTFTGYQTVGSSSDTSNYREGKSEGTVNVPFNDTSYIASYDNVVRNRYQDALKRMDEFVTWHLNPDKREWFVKALLDVIDNDKDILETDKFYVKANGSFMTKAELRMEGTFEYQPFLVGILHYILMKRADKNVLGIPTLDAITEKVKSKERRYNGHLGESIARTVKVDFYKEPSAENKPTDAADKSEEKIVLQPDATVEQSDDEVINGAVIKAGQVLADVLSAIPHPKVNVEGLAKAMAPIAAVGDAYKLTDKQVDNLAQGLSTFAAGVATQKHAMADKIREGNKKAGSSEDKPDSPEVDVAEGAEQTDAIKGEKTVVHQTIVNQYGDHPVHIDHVENLKL